MSQRRRSVVGSYRQSLELQGTWQSREWRRTSPRGVSERAGRGGVMGVRAGGLHDVLLQWAHWSQRPRGTGDGGQRQRLCAALGGGRSGLGA